MVPNGRVLIYPPPGLDGQYPSGVAVSLQAQPSVVDFAIKWNGTDSGTDVNPAAVTMNASRQLTISITHLNYALTINGTQVDGPLVNLALGDVFVSPVPNTRDDRYVPGTHVTLSVQLFVFGGVVRWQGADSTSESNGASVTMNSDRALTLFINTANYGLTVNGIPVTGGTIPVPGGTVTIAPSANSINGRYAAGTQVTLTAQPFSPGAFVGWSGVDGQNTDNPATVTMQADRSVGVTIS